jgi:pimeloyl-ACP methyl ester carboxylesterase
MYLNDKQTLGNLIVVLPGILGSVLTRNDKPLWLSGKNILEQLKAALHFNDDLALHNDSGELEAAGDGVKATQAIQDIALLPGFWKVDGLGYKQLLQGIERHFITERALPWEDKLANLIEFPYDWRRDNRINARYLAKVVDQFLTRWRQETEYKDAKVILIAHSMGGLISRYYLDVLGGWQNCRALFTFGTPYRGSLMAVDALANGVKIGSLIDVSQALRTMPAVYQLLPRYRCLLFQGEYRRVAEMEGLPGIDPVQARDARKFYLEIDDAVKARSGNLNYPLLSYIGISQETKQSAIYTGREITVVKNLPPQIAEAYQDGDGTVPQGSATPVEASLAQTNYVVESHATLQTNEQVINDLLKRLLVMEAPELKDLLGDLGEPSSLAVSLQVGDLFKLNEPVVIRVQPRNPEQKVSSVSVQLTNTSSESDTYPTMNPTADGWVTEIADLPPGCYRVEATVKSAALETKLKNVFIVLEAENAL